MSSPFREQLKADFDIFFNLEEFSEAHQINGKCIPCLLDDMELLERKQATREDQHMDGIFLADCLLYVRAADFGSPPKPGRVITVDGKTYRVASAEDEMGVYSICLETCRS